MDDQLIIEQYVAGKLTSDECAAFEKRLAQEQDLAESLRLYQMTQRFMAQREPVLEQLLDTMGNKYFPAKPWYTKWIIWAFTGLLLLAVAVLFIIYNAKIPAPSTDLPTENKPAPSELAPSATPRLLDTVKTPAPISKEPEPSFTPSTQTDKPPIAAIASSVYKANPILEGLWQEQLRNNQYFELLNPNRDTILITQQQMVIQLCLRTTFPPPYELRVYSNEPSDFYNDNRSLNTIITEAIGQADTFIVNHPINLPLTEGLYYWLLVNKAEELLTVGKFNIVK